jgi:hypothetical protein
MTKVYLLSLLLFIAAWPARAQHAIFLSQGKIEFERKVNQYAQMESVTDPGDESWTELRKKLSGNQFKTDYFDLLFTRNKTLYRPGRESPDNPSQFFFQPPSPIIPWPNGMPAGCWSTGRRELSRRQSIRNIAGHLPEGALLVFNNTRVVEARIVFQKPTGDRSRSFVWSRRRNMAGWPRRCRRRAGCGGNV